MNHFRMIAIISVAVFAVSTGTFGQTIYKCGSSYSQIPCADAVTIQADDARSLADKAGADKAVKRDMKVTAELEKKRLKEEKEVLGQAKSAQKAAYKEADKVAAAKAKAAKEEEEAKNAKAKKEPAIFTAKTVPPPKP